MDDYNIIHEVYYVFMLSFLIEWVYRLNRGSLGKMNIPFFTHTVGVPE